MYPLHSFVTLALLPLAWSARLDAATFAKTNFDFIIVGGGAAGTTVATRLSEVSNFTVGIIEAGHFDPDDERINIPQGTNTGGIQSNPNYSWNFQSVPQKKLSNRSLFMSRGKVLGGSSATNLMGLFLAGPVEYDEIGSLGNNGWNWNNTLKYFKKATNFAVAPADVQEQTFGIFSPAYHGDSGPLHQSFSSWYSTISFNFFAAMRRLGYLTVEDQEIDELDGGVVWNPPLNIDQDTKTRSYAATAYYVPNADRPNLHLLTDAQVTKVNLANKADKDGNYATTGVTYVVDGKTYTVKTQKEVIVSGGGVSSPQILELSGIGRKDVLSKYGIKTIVNLNGVGENYQDHVITTQAVEINSSIATWDIFGNPGPNATAYQQYKDSLTGPYTSSINALGLGTAQQVIGNKEELEGWLSDLDKAFNASNPSIGRRAVYEIERKRWAWDSKDASFEIYCAPVLSFPEHFEFNKSYTHFALIQPHPFTRGSIHINTSNPLAHPQIDQNYWAFDFDRLVTVRGVRYVREQVIDSPEVSSQVVQYISPVDPQTDADYQQHIADTASQPYHPCCTNAMLPKEFDGVVDSSLKVYGTSNLRVIDISILPFNLATHLAGTAYAIAEQGADIIKEAYGFPTS